VSLPNVTQIVTLAETQRLDITRVLPPRRRREARSGGTQLESVGLRNIALWIYDRQCVGRRYCAALVCSDWTVRQCLAGGRRRRLQCPLETLSRGSWTKYTHCVPTDEQDQIVSASYDRIIRAWDVETGAQLRTFSGHSQSTLAVAYDPTGNVLASG